jgi:hypothetical protein
MKTARSREHSAWSKRFYLQLTAISLLLLLSGCATSHVATKIGENIADSFANSAKIGIVSADKIARDWPYISGLLKGTAGGDYERKVPFEVQEIIDNLDDLCGKITLTLEDKGQLIGLVVRLEAKAARFYWDEYGVSLYKWFKIFMTGA